MSALPLNVLRNSPGFGCWQAAIEGVQLAAAASGAASTPWHLRLTLLERLRHALGGLWWASTNELGEPSEVLRRGGQQHLVPSAAQASQPKPVEFEDALHMRKPHLYFLALAARELEGFAGVGESTYVVAHILVDIARDLASDGRRAPGLELADRAIVRARPIGQNAPLIDNA